MVCSIFCLAHKKEVGFDAKPRAVAINLIVTDMGKYIFFIMGSHTQTYVAVPQHIPLSLYTKFEDTSIVKLDFYLWWYNLWIILRGP
jgi:hypothetical protein